jgi:hypothetical protein
MNTTMLVAELIPPDEIKNIECNGCGLSYPQDHYEILLVNRKLAYFEIIDVFYDLRIKGADCLCHGCLFGALKKIGEEKKLDAVKIKLIYKGEDHFLSYDPEDPSDLW